MGSCISFFGIFLNWVFCTSSPRVSHAPEINCNKFSLEVLHVHVSQDTWAPVLPLFCYCVWHFKDFALLYYCNRVVWTSPTCPEIDPEGYPRITLAFLAVRRGYPFCIHALELHRSLWHNVLIHETLRECRVLNCYRLTQHFERGRIHLPHFFACEIFECMRLTDLGDLIEFHAFFEQKSYS